MSTSASTPTHTIPPAPTKTTLSNPPLASHPNLSLLRRIILYLSSLIIILFIFALSFVFGPIAISPVYHILHIVDLFLLWFTYLVLKVEVMEQREPKTLSGARHRLYWSTPMGLYLFGWVAFNLLTRSWEGDDNAPWTVVIYVLELMVGIMVLLEVGKTVVARRAFVRGRGDDGDGSEGLKIELERIPEMEEGRDHKIEV